MRDSDFHNSGNYGFGTGLLRHRPRCGTADNLVENNIARYMNKPIVFNVAGSGNVVGYNYADNSWAIDAYIPAWCQEVNIDFPLLVPAHGADGGELRAPHGRQQRPTATPAT